MMVARIHKLFKRRPRSVLHLVFSLSASHDSIQVAHRALYFFFFFLTSRSSAARVFLCSCLRTQKVGAHGGSNPFKERSLRVHLAHDALDKMLEAMDELDHAEHIPEGMNPLLWEQFCHMRRLKVETEHKVTRAVFTP